MSQHHEFLAHVLLLGSDLLMRGLPRFRSILDVYDDVHRILIAPFMAAFHSSSHLCLRGDATIGIQGIDRKTSC